MLPIPDGAWVTGEFVQDWNTIKDGELYVVLTLNEGLVFKQLKNELAERGCFLLISLNKAYEPYELAATEIREIWKFVHYISKEVTENQLSDNQVELQLKILTAEIQSLKKRMEARH
jgi:SOS-response transcriptional repressor LexA